VTVGSEGGRGRCIAALFFRHVLQNYATLVMSHSKVRLAE